MFKTDAYSVLSAAANGHEFEHVSTKERQLFVAAVERFTMYAAPVLADEQAQDEADTYVEETNNDDEQPTAEYE